MIFHCPVQISYVYLNEIKVVVVVVVVRLNKVPNCSFGGKKELIKKARGFMATATDEGTGVAICSWKDINIVTVASNGHGVEPLKPTERFCRAKNEV